MVALANKFRSFPRSGWSAEQNQSKEHGMDGKYLAIWGQGIGGL